MAILDNLDKQLIKILHEDARRSSEVVAKELGVSPATVRRRIRRLVKNGVMHVIALVEPEKIGLHLTAVVALDVDHEKLNSVMNKLIKRPEVIWVATTTGRFDILLLARFPSHEELSEFVQGDLAKVEGVRDSETFICLRQERKHFLIT